MPALVARKKRSPKKKQKSLSMRHSKVIDESLPNQTFQKSSILERTSLLFGELSDNSSSSLPSSPASNDDINYSFEKPIDSDEEYEFATCGKKSCGFSFCTKCFSKTHPKQKCRNLSPVSPTRSDMSQNNSSIACSKQSLRSLRRLFK